MLFILRIVTFELSCFVSMMNLELSEIMSQAKAQNWKYAMSFSAD